VWGRDERIGGEDRALTRGGRVIVYAASDNRDYGRIGEVLNLGNIVFHILERLLKRLQDGTLSMLGRILELDLDGESLSLGGVAKVFPV
jgi:hypothetical protein